MAISEKYRNIAGCPRTTPKQSCNAGLGWAGPATDGPELAIPQILGFVRGPRNSTELYLGSS